MVPPKGPSLAFSTSTWIHWWSPVASANWSTRSWVISTQSVVPISSPAADSMSSNELNTRMDDAPRGSEPILDPGQGVGWQLCRMTLCKLLVGVNLSR